MQLDLTKSPYNLSKHDILWVNDTLENMTLKEKIGQLFFLQGMVNTTNLQNEIIETIGPGGFLFRSGESKELMEAHINVTKMSKYPLFLGGIAENGAGGVVRHGNIFGNNMLIAATDDEQNAYDVAQLIGEEVGLVGTNILLDPVVDIDMNCKCSITNVRAFGDNKDIVAKMSSAYVEGLLSTGIRAIPRHFPGHGVDERNPSLITTVNSLSLDKWDATYGEVYKALIDKGVGTLLISSIALPKVVKTLKPEATEEEMRKPANLSDVIIERLLKERLGYKGLIISDSTLTASFNGLGKREELLPKLIASGCDMFLFAKDYLEDYISVLKGCKNGIITNSRLNEAVTKILATKVSMGLHHDVAISNKNKFFNKGRSIVMNSKIASEGITLVKDEQCIIPINKVDSRNILVIYLDRSDEILNIKGKTLKVLLGDRLSSEGFNIIERNYSSINNNIKYMNENIKSFKESVDLVIYIANVKPSSLRNSARINYKSALGLDAPWFVKEIPTIFISLSNPYHMYDMPMISTFINCYYGTEAVINNLVDKLIGKSEFKGKSPVKPFFDFYGSQENRYE